MMDIPLEVLFGFAAGNFALSGLCTYANVKMRSPHYSVAILFGSFVGGTLSWLDVAMFLIGRGEMELAAVMVGLAFLAASITYGIIEHGGVKNFTFLEYVAGGLLGASIMFGTWFARALVVS